MQCGVNWKCINLNANIGTTSGTTSGTTPGLANPLWPIRLFTRY